MLQNLQKNYIAIIFGISFLINSFVTLSFLYFIYKWKFEMICDCGYSNESTKIEYNYFLRAEKPIKFIPQNFENNFKENKFRIYSRNTWLAETPSNNIIKMQLPIEKVVIAHTATANCMNQKICSRQIHAMQNYHMKEKHFSDISYNFLIGGDGTVYEGRGWNKQPACSKGLNNESICISLIGNFMETIPTPEQLNGTKMLLEAGIKLGKLTDSYKLYGHRQLIPTLSPGDFLYELIQNWSHFTKN